VKKILVILAAFVLAISVLVSMVVPVVASPKVNEVGTINWQGNTGGTFFKDALGGLHELTNLKLTVYSDYTVTGHAFDKNWTTGVVTIPNFIWGDIEKIGDTLVGNLMQFIPVFDGYTNLYIWWYFEDVGDPDQGPTNDTFGAYIWLPSFYPTPFPPTLIVDWPVTGYDPHANLGLPPNGNWGVFVSDAVLSFPYNSRNVEIHLK
jgi:hypothetical protein